VVAAVVGAFGTRGAPKRFNWGTPSECCASWSARLVRKMVIMRIFVTTPL